MNIEEIKMDHFENFEELIKTCKMWLRDDDVDAYYRFFEFNCMKALITAYEKEKEKNMVTVPTASYILQDKIHSLEKELYEEKEENKRLRKCHLQYEEMTGIDLLLPSKEE